jgi:hypothetical protein
MHVVYTNEYSNIYDSCINIWLLFPYSFETGGPVWSFVDLFIKRWTPALCGSTGSPTPTAVLASCAPIYKLTMEFGSLSLFRWHSAGGVMGIRNNFWGMTYCSCPVSLPQEDTGGNPSRRLEKVQTAPLSSLPPASATVVAAPGAKRC